MFDRIARVYDPMNTAMSAGLHHRWRARAADMAGLVPGQRVLDLATGTGDLALELAARVWPEGEVVGADFSEAMLDRARAKASRPPADGAARPRVEPRFEWADAMSLPYPDDRFDAATAAFGVRNFEDLGRGLAEMARVVRPGGRVVVLEMTTPTRAPLSLFYRLWFDRLVPVLGRLAETVARTFSRRGAGGGEAIGAAYSYLPSSVRRFPGPSELAAEMGRVGIVGVAGVLLAGGIVAIHAGTVAEQPSR
jgi:demethylmenaquinone methyltransferase/2-methoxy-6-polyprenyl-1,4-benzoquinol methylase